MRYVTPPVRGLLCVIYALTCHDRSFAGLCGGAYAGPCDGPRDGTCNGPCDWRPDGRQARKDKQLSRFSYITRELPGLWRVVPSSCLFSCFVSFSLLLLLSFCCVLFLVVVV